MHDVAFFVLVIGQVTGAVFHDAQTQTVEQHRLPRGIAGFAGMIGFGNGIPVNGLKRDGVHALLVFDY